MKYKNLLITLFFCFCLAVISRGQHPLIKPLKLGDTVPELELNVINYKSSKVRLSDFKGKLLILDFWSTICIPCIRMFPHYEALQKKFGDKVFILPVGFETQFESENITDFLFKRKNTSNEIRLPTAIQNYKKDSVLSSLFPFKGVPTIIWIDTNGVFMSITNHLPVQENVIQKILQGEQVKLPQKTIDPVDRHIPLWTYENPGTDNSFLYRSIVTGYKPGIKIASFSQERDSLFTLIRILNLPVIYMLKTAFDYYNPDIEQSLIYDPLEKRLLIESSRKLPVRPPTKDYLEVEEFKYENYYCYELFLPPSYSVDEGFEITLNELQKFFRLNISVEKKNVKCLALVRTSKKDKLHTKGGKSVREISEDYSTLKTRNSPLSSLLKYLNEEAKIPYVIDETNYKDSIDIEIHLTDLGNLALIRDALKKYDLDLVPVERQMNMLIVRDLPEKKIKPTILPGGK